ncbi:golgin subfamily A member 1-like [Mizuhopecten yessoensis]|uniref:golgin subfamily A member 1-like n=1 Tax=Mizuhopecten yessoensis TaxID=6573 RepID=UPI000B458AEF|nr:golgin subfamily A member 1-like [Mizuhopecten yessoensis]
MFKNLKKKLEQQGESVSDSERSLPGSPVPVHQTSTKPGTQVSSPLSRDRHGYESDSGASYTGSYAGAGHAVNSRPTAEFTGTPEELTAALSKRSEQCKKYEATIKEYAAIIKDKNRNTEKLEQTLKKQEDETVQKVQELQEQFQCKQAKMSEGFTLALQKKDEEREEVEQRLQQVGDYKEKFFKREEENDEFQGLATQELAKVKHMLLITQEEMTTLQLEFKDKSTRLDQREQQVEKYEQEVTSLQSQLDGKVLQCGQLEEETQAHSKMVAKLASEKEACEKSIEKLNEELSQLSGQLQSAEKAKAELENENETLRHNFDQHRNKTTQLLEEKDDHVSQLQDRVKMLEQRVADHSLDGDDRVQAVIVERDNLEKKLEETHQQLSEIKMTWSNKISHLEEQIAHLNKKIMEDNEEMARSQKSAETSRQQLKAQISDLQSKSEDAENRAEENWQLANKKDSLFEAEKHELQAEINKSHMEKVDMETQLIAKVTSLESQLQSMEEAKVHEKSVVKQNIAQLESQQQSYLDNAVKSERRMEEVEQEKNRVMNENLEKSEELTTVQKELADLQTSKTELESKVTKLEEQVKSTKLNTDGAKEQKAKLKASEKERDELMVRNAELSQQLKCMEVRKSSEEKQLSGQVKENESVIEALQQEVNDKVSQAEQMSEKLQQYEGQMKELEVQRSKSMEESSTMSTLQQTVTSLEEQLADKNKALKKQEQRLADLKKTLQRELKVQALPNDEPIVVRSASDQNLLSQRLTPPSRTSPPKDYVNNVGGLSPNRLLEVRNSPNDRKSVSVHMPGGDNSLDNEVNFQYLKHVVLKFMLSREAEALHLIRAVSVLLRFTHEEQKLIRETLEWKKSWFGSRPQTGAGQMTRFIPPSY